MRFATSNMQAQLHEKALGSRGKCYKILEELVEIASIGKNWKSTILPHQEI